MVGLVDANGTVDTTTVLKSAGTAQIIRSAATTDGERLWATGGNGGIVTATRAARHQRPPSPAVPRATSAPSPSRAASCSAPGILADRLATVGTGVPTSGSLTDCPGLPDNLLTYGYAFADLTAAGFDGTTLDTLYIADASSRGGTVDKYRWNGSHLDRGRRSSTSPAPSASSPTCRAARSASR